MKNHRFIRMIRKVFSLERLHLRMDDALNVFQVEDDTGQAQESMVGIVRTLQIGVANFIDVDSEFHVPTDPFDAYRALFNPVAFR